MGKAGPSDCYEESLRRIDRLRDLDGADVSLDGRTIFLAHGQKTDKTIVFFHGNTNSPRQFAALGGIFYERGYNVLIPRVAHHGLKDRMTKDLARLTASELIKACDACVDIARGLGRHITVVGFSMGANMAGWVAQNRSDVDKAVIIAPFWGWKGLPAYFFRPFIVFLSVMPNRFVWWDKKAKTALVGPTSSYYGFSTRGVGQIMGLGWSVMKQARRVAPKAGAIVIVTSGLDDAVDENNLDKVVDDWRRHGHVGITRYKFDSSFCVFHDMIDPQQPYQKVALVYPKLIELIDGFATTHRLEWLEDRPG